MRRKQRRNKITDEGQRKGRRGEEEEREERESGGSIIAREASFLVHSMARIFIIYKTFLEKCNAM